MDELAGCLLFLIEIFFLYIVRFLAILFVLWLIVNILNGNLL